MFAPPTAIYTHAPGLNITTCKDQRQAMQIIDNIKIPQSVSNFDIL